MEFIVNPKYRVIIDNLALVKKGTPLFIEEYSKCKCAYLAIPPKCHRLKDFLCLSASKEELPEIWPWDMYNYVNFFLVRDCKIYVDDIEPSSCSLKERFSMFTDVWSAIHYD